MLKRVLIILLSNLLAYHLHAQTLRNPLPDYYNTAQQRLLVFTTGSFLFGIRQGELDLDSAMLFACKIYNLNRLLPYTEGYAENGVSKACILLQEGRVLDVKKTLPALKGEAAIQLCAELGSYYLFMPGALIADLDSARFYLRKADSLSSLMGSRKWQREAQSLLGKYYAQAGDILQSQRYFTAVANDCRKEQDDAALATVLLDQGYYLPFGAPGRAGFLVEARRLFEKAGKPVKAYQALSALVTEYFLTDMSKVLEKLEEQAALEDKIGFRHHQYVQNVLAYMYIQRTDYMTAMEHAEASLKSMEATRDTVFSSLFCQRLEQLLANMGREQEAAIWRDRALSVPLSRENQAFWYSSFLGKLNTLLKLGEPQKALSLIEEIDGRFPPVSIPDKMHVAYFKGSCYKLIDQPQQAMREFDVFTAVAMQYPPRFIYDDIIGPMIEIGLFYATLHNYTTAEKYLQKVNTLPFTKYSVNSLAQWHLLQFKIDSVAGRQTSALRHYQQYKQFSDSVFNMEQRHRLDELLVKYEAARKDNNIKLLQQQQELQDSQLKQSAFNIRMTIGGIALLLIILGLLYSRYRIKQKSGKETEQKNVELQKLVDEKEWLLKEIHHRVKNNLQTVVSLLESQSAYLADDALLALQDSQNRIYAMSLIHQKLYQSENVVAIRMGEYLPELVNYLRDSFNIKQGILFNLDIDPVELDVSQAIPIGLIINEAINNSIKYAFDGAVEKNKIHLIMKKLEDGEVLLTIADNGKGLPEGFKDGSSSGLGLKLMRGLTDDIGGQFSIYGHEGTVISIQFMANEPFTGSAVLPSKTEMV